MLAVVLAVALLSGCGMKNFSNSFTVRVDEPQQVGVFDSEMGQSAEWAARTMGPAAPGDPYTVQIVDTDSKMAFDASPPSSIQVGLYLPGVTETGYYSVIINDVTPGTSRFEAPFIPWYSETPVEPRPTLPLTLEIAAGDTGWVVTMTPEVRP